MTIGLNRCQLIKMSRLECVNLVTLNKLFDKQLFILQGQNLDGNTKRNSSILVAKKIRIQILFDFGGCLKK